MARLFYHTMQDNAGNLLFGVSGTMRLAGSGTLATIYGDEALTIPIANPMANHPSFGSFKCFLGAGDYDFYMAKAGYTFETLTGVQGYGTMAQQDAAAVAIEGGNVTGLTSLHVASIAGLGASPVGGFALATGPTPVYIGGLMGLGVNPPVAKVDIFHSKDLAPGIAIRPAADAGLYATVQFLSAAGGNVGSITTTGAATAYNTSSDARLKKNITPLTGALDVVRQLLPVGFLWKADGSPGRGFLADEVQRVVPEAVTGAPDAVDEAGQIVPQGLDLSKLVPYLVGACQALAAQVEALTARLEAAGG